MKGHTTQLIPVIEQRLLFSFEVEVLFYSRRQSRLLADVSAAAAAAAAILCFSWLHLRWLRGRERKIRFVRAFIAHFYPCPRLSRTHRSLRFNTSNLHRNKIKIWIYTEPPPDALGAPLYRIDWLALHIRKEKCWTSSPVSPVPPEKQWIILFISFQ